MSDISAFNGRTEVTLDFGFEVKEAAICDMLENFTQALETCGNKVKLTARNFEIVTLRIKV